MNAKQIAEINALIAPFGLQVKRMPKKSSSYLATIRAWKPETPAGRKCKSSLIKWSAVPPMQGARNWRELKSVGYMPNDPHVIAAYYADLDAKQE
jgi:hypothetical protein